MYYHLEKSFMVNYEPCFPPSVVNDKNLTELHKRLFGLMQFIDIWNDEPMDSYPINILSDALNVSLEVLTQLISELDAANHIYVDADSNDRCIWRCAEF